MKWQQFVTAPLPVNRNAWTIVSTGALVGERMPIEAIQRMC